MGTKIPTKELVALSLFSQAGFIFHFATCREKKVCGSALISEVQLQCIPHHRCFINSSEMTVRFNQSLSYYKQSNTTLWVFSFLDEFSIWLGILHYLGCFLILLLFNSRFKILPFHDLAARTILLATCKGGTFDYIKRFGSGFHSVWNWDVLAHLGQMMS